MEQVGKTDDSGEDQPRSDDQAANRVELAFERLRSVDYTDAPPRIPHEEPSRGEVKPASLFEGWLAAQKEPTPSPREPSVILRPMVPTIAEREENETTKSAPPPKPPNKPAKKPSGTRRYRGGGSQVFATQDYSPRRPKSRSWVQSIVGRVTSLSGRGLVGAVVAVGVASPAVQSDTISYYDAEHRFALQLPNGWSSSREMRFGRSGVKFNAPQATGANCHVGIHPAAQFGELSTREIEARVANVDTKGFWTTTLDERAWSPVNLEFFGTMPIGDQVLHYSISKFTTKLGDRGVVPVNFRLGFVYTQGVIYSVSCMAIDDGKTPAPDIADIFTTFRVTSPYPRG